MSSESTRLRGIFQSIADAIRSKTGKSATMTPDEMPDEITSISGGGTPEVEEKDVNFIDYDGTVLYSYTAQEALALDALPANPSHEGLTAQGWNYTLAEVKTEVNAVGGATVGQMYVTDDGKTRLYISVKSIDKVATFSFGLSGEVVVDWGDNTRETYTPELFEYKVVTATHTYAENNDYVITMWAISGDITFTESFVKLYNNLIYLNKIELGENIIIDTGAFSGCNTLSSITMPYGEIEIGESAFGSCPSLSNIIIPNSVTSIYQGAFYDCATLSSISIPNSITIIPDEMVSQCFALRQINIPGSIISIGGSSFDFTNLLDLTLPNNLTEIKEWAFNARCCMIYHFKSVTPPTLSNEAIPFLDNMIIYVPAASLDTYKTATNWSSYASHMIGE